VEPRQHDGPVARVLGRPDQGGGELGQGYQDRKAAAAAQIQAELGQITDAYNNALEGNQSQLDSALADAYARAVQAALTNPPASSSGDSSTPAKHQAKPPKRGKKSHLSHAAGGGGRGAYAS
jgi:hypothetical protein